jgi:hypothetical protein
MESILNIEHLEAIQNGVSPAWYCLSGNRFNGGNDSVAKRDFTNV